jgi:predicted RNA binding protein YcfA (HicA-like mRNA interferase family)
MRDSQRLPRITGEQLVKALQKAGFEIARLTVAELEELLRR